MVVYKSVHRESAAAKIRKMLKNGKHNWKISKDCDMNEGYFQCGQNRLALQDASKKNFFLNQEKWITRENIKG